MYLVAIAWMYVALMMAIAEATHVNGSVLGAIMTFVLYGLLPLAIVMYVMGAPIRRKARLQEEHEATAAPLPAGAPTDAIEPESSAPSAPPR
jgi:Na+-transporting methylmalonyl-CoA/oxaloacetate decarboxylase gamma subunit